MGGPPGAGVALLAGGPEQVFACPWVRREHHVVGGPEAVGAPGRPLRTRGCRSSGAAWRHLSSQSASTDFVSSTRREVRHRTTDLTWACTCSIMWIRRPATSRKRGTNRSTRPSRRMYGARMTSSSRPEVVERDAVHALLDLEGVLPFPEQVDGPRNELQACQPAQYAVLVAQHVDRVDRAVPGRQAVGEAPGRRVAAGSPAGRAAESPTGSSAGSSAKGSRAQGGSRKYGSRSSATYVPSGGDRERALGAVDVEPPRRPEAPVPVEEDLAVPVGAVRQDVRALDRLVDRSG